LNEHLTCFTRLKLDDPNNKSLEAIFEVLKNNTHQAVIVENFQDKSGNFILDYFLNIEMAQVVSWIIWSSGVFGLFLACFFKIKMMSVEKIQGKVVVHPSKGSILFKYKKRRNA